MTDNEAEKEKGSQDPQAQSAALEKPAVEGADGKPAEIENAEGNGNYPSIEELAADEKGKMFEIKKLRSDRRSLREENERLMAELESLRTNKPEHAPENRQDEPDEVESKVMGVLQRERIKENREEAFNHILSQDDVATDKDMDEIAEVMRDTGLDLLAKAKPFSAAELGLKEWRSRKISAGNKATDAEKAGAQDIPKGGKAAGGSASSKKLWSRTDITKMSDEDYEKNRSELLAASREGRIK